MAGVADRDWHEYNERLVNEVLDLFVSSDLLVNQQDQLIRMNDGKNGRPFIYPDALILIILAVKEYFGLPYRQAEGFARMLGGIWGARIPSYTQICRRQKALKVPLGARYDDGHPVDLAIDSTGIKAFNRGEWMRQEWGVRRGWIKMHITCDVDKHVITSVAVTDERTGDGRKLKELVGKAEETVGEGRVGKVYGDSAYDSREDFNYIASMGAEPVIKPKINSSGKSRGSYVRAKAVREFLEDPKGWKRRHRYGTRWQVEAVFSSLKRMMGEYVSSVVKEGILNEVLAKAFTYNMVVAHRNGM